MGWLYSSNWKSQRDVINHLSESINNEKFDLIDSSAKSGELYQLIKNKENGEKIIICYMIKQFNGEFGYKGMDEGMGPNMYNCPERILRQSTYTQGFAEKWRADCRDIAKRKKWLNTVVKKELKSNQIVEHSYHGELTFLYWYNKTRSQFVARNFDGNTFRYKTGEIVKIL